MKKGGSKIIILGSGSGVPSVKRGAPGLVIKTGKQTLLFDSGSGTLNRLLKAGIDYREIDYIFYTHFHPDHVAELVPILFANKYHSEPRTKTLRIIGPAGLKKLYQGMLGIFGEWITPELYAVEFEEFNKKKKISGDGWTVYAKSMMHSKACLGYRLEEKGGRSIVYSGDTDYCKAAVELAKGADVLILECSFPEEYKMAWHLTPRTAGKIAKEARCGHLVLTHLYPICDRYNNILAECRKEFKGRITVARDLLCVK